jgi:tyrosyl-tRNA synthetase
MAACQHDDMDLLDDLRRRGLLHDTTDAEALAATLAQGGITLYHGIDPTADSLHVGNLLGLIMLRRFLDAGHHVIALAGGATGMIGDPSGRSEERNLLDEPTLRHNVAAIKAQITRVLGPDGNWDMVDNYEWTRDVTLLDFLRDVGKHVTVNQMIARESVKTRMAGDQGISFTEFSYMLLQAFDFWWLNQHKHCELQIGGSDQWGNILGGIDLIRRRAGTVAHGLCWPLLTAADGSKLGKSTGARVWLDPLLTSPYQFRQYWISTEDADVAQRLHQFTLLATDEIHAVMATHGSAPERRVAQRALAREVTTLVHGTDAWNSADRAAEVLFGGDPTQADDTTFEVLAAEVPTSTLTSTEFAALDVPALLTHSGLASSLSDARRGLTQRAFAINGVKASADATLESLPRLAGRWILLSKGRKSFHVVRISQ